MVLGFNYREFCVGCYVGVDAFVEVEGCLYKVFSLCSVFSILGGLV